MTVILHDLRFRVMDLLIFATDKCVNFSITRGNLIFTGGTGDDIEDVMLALREAVAVGHASEKHGCYRPTQAGRDWHAAESAVRQSQADARERAATERGAMTPPAERKTCATCVFHRKRQHPGPGFLFPMCANPESENHGCVMVADDTCTHHTAREGRSDDASE